MNADQNNAQAPTVSEFSVGGWSGRGSLRDLVEELRRRRDSMVDFVADTRTLRVRCGKDGAFLCANGGNSSEFLMGDTPISDSAIGQLAERMSPTVPTKFAKAIIAERPEIAERLFTDLLRETGSRNLVRVLDGRVRAFLSDRYQPIDNETLAFAALDLARENGAEVVECSLTDRQMRIKLTTRSIFDAIEERRVGDKSGWYAGGLGDQKFLRSVAAKTGGDLPGGPGTIHPIVTIGNSETGHGSLYVRIGILRAICFNLATVESLISQIHLGGRLDLGIFSQETIRAESQATLLKARDSIATSFSETKFRAIVAKVKAAQGVVVVNPGAAVDLAVDRSVIPQEKRDALLAHFLGGDVDLTAYGFAQAVSRLSQEVEDSDDAEAMEAFSGAVIADPKILATAI